MALRSEIATGFLTIPLKAIGVYPFKTSLPTKVLQVTLLPALTTFGADRPLAANDYTKPFSKERDLPQVQSKISLDYIGIAGKFFSTLFILSLRAHNVFDWTATAGLLGTSFAGINITELTISEMSNAATARRNIAESTWK